MNARKKDMQKSKIRQPKPKFLFLQTDPFKETQLPHNQ